MGDEHQLRHEPYNHDPKEACELCGGQVVTIEWQELATYVSRFHLSDVENLERPDVGLVEAGSDIGLKLASGEGCHPVRYTAREITAIHTSWEPPAADIDTQGLKAVSERDFYRGMAGFATETERHRGIVGTPNPGPMAGKTRHPLASNSLPRVNRCGGCGAAIAQHATMCAECICEEDITP